MLNQQALEKYLTTAHDAGMPRDQVEDFVNAGYVAQPKQCLFHSAARMADHESGPVEILMGGARGGAKSHAVMAQVVLDDCVRTPGLRWLYLRNIQRSATEAFEDLIERVMKYEPHHYLRNEGLLKLPNGSHVICGGFRSEQDIDKYIGLEYDGCIIEEATTVSARKKDLLYGSIRTGRTDWRPRKYLTTNPGGVSHQLYKKEFVEPFRKGTQQDTLFIPSTYKDNAFLDVGYINYLESLTGILGRMWRDGDWDVAAGMALPDFDYDLHTIPPFEVPDTWTKIRGHDYGFIHPAFTLWRAKEPSTGRIFIYREWKSRLLSEEYQARGILDLTPSREHISNTYAGPDMWEHKAGKKNDKEGKPITFVTTRAQEFIDEGVMVTPADNHRKNGLAKIHNLLGLLPDGKPGLQITRDCVDLIECLQSVLSNPSEPEDVLKVDADPETGEGGDDPYDTLRYILTDANTKPVKKTKREPLPLQRLMEGRT